MVVETFSKRMVDSGILNTYVAAVFFASSIFFVLHSSHFTPIEMTLGVIIATIVFKGVANMMLSMAISFVRLDNQQDEVDFKKESDNLEALINDLAIQEAAIQSNKNNTKKK